MAQQIIFPFRISLLENEHIATTPMSSICAGMDTGLLRFSTQEIVKGDLLTLIYGKV
jgi:hypothetical protein